MKFSFIDSNKNLVETEAKTELAARRKIRRLDRKLSEKGIFHLHRGRLKLLDENCTNFRKETNI